MCVCVGSCTYIHVDVNVCVGMPHVNVCLSGLLAIQHHQKVKPTLSNTKPLSYACAALGMPALSCSGRAPRLKERCSLISLLPICRDEITHKGTFQIL